tara:strand:+ start:29 stop:568 length:540 start_codon:yes stop_codon:yes gene_type:complete
MSQLKVNSIIPVAGIPTGGGGGITQIKQTVKKDVFSVSLATGAVSGDVMTVSITPTSSTNKILIIPTLSVTAYANFIYLYKDGSLISDAIGDASSTSGVARASFATSGNVLANMTHTNMYLDTAGGTSAITYSIRLQHNQNSTQTVYLNRSADNEASPVIASYIFARYISTLTAVEVSA